MAKFVNKSTSGPANLIKKPKAAMGRTMGRGNDQPGLGSAGGHKNVVNPASHMSKLKNC